MQSPRTTFGIAIALLVPLAIAIFLTTYAGAGAKDGTDKIAASVVEALAGDGVLWAGENTGSG